MGKITRELCGHDRLYPPRPSLSHTFFWIEGLIDELKKKKKKVKSRFFLGFVHELIAVLNNWCIPLHSHTFHREKGTLGKVGAGDGDVRES